MKVSKATVLAEISTCNDLAETIMPVISSRLRHFFHHILVGKVVNGLAFLKVNG